MNRENSNQTVQSDQSLYCSEQYFGWLVGCFGFNGPFRQYFSLNQTVSQREGERREKG